ncbi:DUF6090 family protein [Psychroserpens luteolus]|uniref:DUF6090 family protein n=1 Tax=Psychroserpens luteolus TaxID=2855840 RepID=UPI001E3EA8EB|nr:DUF6090 family protein [Psychroserpens luteolus]MCD2260239.1 hypothetical protein [Psychroserpens luteolus]
MKKKLVYAFGEILIVIIGISLAFAMSKWGENTANNAQKAQYINNLKQDIEADKIQLEANLVKINEKIELCGTLIPVLGSNDPEKPTKLRGVYNIANLTNFTPKDYTHQTLVNSGDLKLMNDFKLKSDILKHYSIYKDIQKAYQRQEAINKDYLGRYFIYNTDYDLMREGKSPFTDEKLLKNIMQSVRGSFMIKRDATQRGINSCDSILKVLK